LLPPRLKGLGLGGSSIGDVLNMRARRRSVVRASTVVDESAVAAGEASVEVRGLDFTVEMTRDCHGFQKTGKYPWF